MSTPATGRPREARIDAAVPRAVLELLEEGGWRALSVEAAVRRAGASKPAFYRRWTGLEPCVVDALSIGLQAGEPPAATGDLRADVLAQLQQVVDSLGRRGVREGIAGLLAAAATRPEVWDDFLDRVIRPRRAAMAALLEAARDRGELRAEVDVAQLLDALAGPLYYRGLFGHEPLHRAFVAAVVDGALASARPR